MISFLSRATVESRDIEIMANNSAFSESKLYYRPSGKTGDEKLVRDHEDEDESAGQPHLQVTAAHNVNQFVNAGDEVIFELTLNNSGDHSYETRMMALLIDGEGNVIGGGEIPLGKVTAGEKIGLSFQMQIPPDAGSGTYSLLAWAEGFNNLDDYVESNEAITSFQVNGQWVSATLSSADESPLSVGEVLGAGPDLAATAPMVSSPFHFLQLLVLLIIEAIIRRVRMVSLI